MDDVEEKKVDTHYEKKRKVEEEKKIKNLRFKGKNDDTFIIKLPVGFMVAEFEDDTETPIPDITFSGAEKIVGVLKSIGIEIKQ